MPSPKPWLKPAPVTPTTVGQLARQGQRWFEDAGICFGHGTTNACDEAIYLTLFSLGLPLGVLPEKKQVNGLDAARVRQVFIRRIKLRLPAAYLTEEAWLGPFSFYADSRALIPRSYIAELLLGSAPFEWPSTPKIRRALDLCTGSACLAILLAKRFKSTAIDATDISKEALEVARINLTRYRLGKKIQLKVSDYFSQLDTACYDVIISNPPYVRQRVMHSLPEEYRQEPEIALAGGKDGLDAVRIILNNAATHLSPGGLLVVECGHARSRVERAWPRMAFFWPLTSGGDDCVFVLTREGLLAGLAR